MRRWGIQFWRRATANEFNRSSPNAEEVEMACPHVSVRMDAESKYELYWQLRDATEEGDLDKFIEALRKYSTEEGISSSDVIDIQGPSGNSLLHVAAGIENPNILQALVEDIPDGQLVAKANYQGDTALHVAARAGTTQAAMLLLDYHDGVMDIANNTGNTALHEAVKNRHNKMTLLLLSRGSRAECLANKEEKCPLYLAVESGKLKILKRLMEAMDENEVPWSTMQGMSPVHGAVMHQRLGQ